MDRRVAFLAATLTLALILPFSVVALASPPAQPATAPLAAPGDPPSITASGTGIVPPTGSEVFFTPQTLFIAAQSKSGAADVDTAATEMQARLLAIKAALVKLGVPAAGIRFQALNLQPQYGPPAPGAPSPVDKGQPLPQQILSFTIAANMTADIPDAKLLVPAINGATANGATTVNSGYGKGGQLPTTQPSAEQLELLAADALKNARATAEALASVSGKKLGALRSIASQQIYPDCCPSANGWRMQITAIFDIAQ